MGVVWLAERCRPNTRSFMTMCPWLRGWKRQGQRGQGLCYEEIVSKRVGRIGRSSTFASMTPSACLASWTTILLYISLVQQVSCSQQVVYSRNFPSSLSEHNRSKGLKKQEVATANSGFWKQKTPKQSQKPFKDIEHLAFSGCPKTVPNCITKSPKHQTEANKHTRKKLQHKDQWSALFVMLMLWRLKGVPKCCKVFTREPFLKGVILQYFVITGLLKADKPFEKPFYVSQ